MDKNYTHDENEILKTRTGLEIQKAKQGDDFDFSAYLICFGLDETGESIASDAFDWQLMGGHTIPSLYGHDRRTVIGNCTSYLKDEKGWIFNWRLNQTQAGKDALELVKHGDITGVSIGFYSEGPELDITDPETGRIINHIFTRCRAFEGSIVVSPAHDMARIIQVKKERSEKIENKERSAFLQAVNEFLKEE